MKVTDSTYGSDLRNAFNNGSVPTTSGNLTYNEIDSNKLVYWAESHDTWSNNKGGGYSNEMPQNVIDRAYAIAASREGATALYFSRPEYRYKDNIMAGVKGSTHFTSPEVAAVNHFHNAMAGTSDYYCTKSDNSVAAVCRPNGAVVVKAVGNGLLRKVLTAISDALQVQSEKQESPYFTRKNKISLPCHLLRAARLLPIQHCILITVSIIGATLPCMFTTEWTPIPLRKEMPNGPVRE